MTHHQSQEVGTSQCLLNRVILSSNEASSSSLKPGPGASKLALKALKVEVDDGTISLFNTRYEEGYGISSDTLYTAWAKLKRATQPLVDINERLQSSKPCSKSCQHVNTLLSIMQQWSATGRCTEDSRTATGKEDDEKNGTATQAPLW